MIIKYCLITIISIISIPVNWLLAPVAVLFSSEDGWLPKWLWWFQTPDNPLNGDDGWKTEHRPFLLEDTRFKRWVNRTAWLYRNSMYGLSESVLGFTLVDGFKYSVEGFDLKGNKLSAADAEKIGNRPLFEGTVKRTLINGDGKEYWQNYTVEARDEEYCKRFNFGWKLWGELKAGDKISHVFSPSVTMGYSK